VPSHITFGLAAGGYVSYFNFVDDWSCRSCLNGLLIRRLFGYFWGGIRFLRNLWDGLELLGLWLGFILWSWVGIRSHALLLGLITSLFYLKFPWGLPPYGFVARELAESQDFPPQVRFQLGAAWSVEVVLCVEPVEVFVFFPWGEDRLFDSLVVGELCEIDKAGNVVLASEVQVVRWGLLRVKTELV
jgi:hypothetical protein